MKPTIILGMHRSGTSLLAKLMSRMNIHMGKDINNHFESGYFLRINENILRIAHTYWDYPKNMNFLINEPKTYDNIIQAIHKQINSSQFRKHFLGKINILQKINSLEDFKWGWKEPRTTITFPLWAKIFPDAKFIYLYRNGIDVAASLQKRELNRRGNINSKPYSLRCLNLERAFEVWEEYNNFFFENSGIISNENLLLVSYEDLLSFPEKILT